MVSLTTSSFVNAENKITIKATITEDGYDERGLKIEEYLRSLPQKKSYELKQRPLMIQGALNVEIENLVHALKNPTVYKFSNYLYIAGNYQNYPVVISRTEQGTTNAAASTVIGIEKFNPVAVISQGTAGGNISSLHVNDIVIGEKSVNLGAYKTKFTPAGTGIDISKQDMRGTFAYNADLEIFQRHKEFRADTKLLEVAKSVTDSHQNFKTVTGTIGTDNSWIELLDYMKFLHEKYGAICAEMETASAAQICKSESVPFIGIRVISNNAAIGETFLADTAYTVQNFVLFVAEKYIESIGKR